MAERVPQTDLLVAIMNAVRPVRLGKQRRRSTNPQAWQQEEDEARTIALRILGLFDQAMWAVIRKPVTAFSDAVTHGDQRPPLTEQDVEDWR